MAAFNLWLYVALVNLDLVRDVFLPQSFHAWTNGGVNRRYYCELDNYFHSVAIFPGRSD